MFPVAQAEGRSSGGSNRKLDFSRTPCATPTRHLVRCAHDVPPSPQGGGISTSASRNIQIENDHTSSVTVTGTWSDGRSQPRASRVILKSLTLSLRSRDTQ